MWWHTGGWCLDEEWSPEKERENPCSKGRERDVLGLRYLLVALGGFVSVGENSLTAVDRAF